MKISSVNRMNAETEYSGKAQAADSKSQEFQAQINNVQSELKDVAVSKELNDEEKEKKQKELKQQIKDLNHQLRQHQIEMQKEQRENRKKAVDMSGEEQDNKIEAEEPKTTGMSNFGMKAIISASSAVNHANSHGNLAMAADGRVRVLQAEIKQDEVYGRDTEIKQKELKTLEEKATRLKGAKVNFLSDASKEMKEAARKELQGDKKIGKGNKGDSVKSLAAPFLSANKQKTDIYVKGNLFSNVDFHF